MAVRSAEASRTASCSFADRVAELSVSFYRNQCPQDVLESFNQTVLATIMLQRDKDADGTHSDTSETTLHVVSMGVGTKVVSAHTIMSHKSGARLTGDQMVRDNHAEVLARRGFMRFLYNQIQMRMTSCADFDESFCIFQPPLPREKLVLKDGVRFHLYTSSQPCGNASIKRWAKVKPLRFQEELSVDMYPLESHPRIQVTPESRQEGQVALLVKRNNASKPLTTTDEAVPVECSVKPSEVSSAHVPVGTALPSSGEGNVMTCSDKIALWNALGLQGALLTTFMQPVYLSTITVGRKFSQVHCQRALCCRLQDFCYPAGAAGSKKTSKKRKQEKHGPATAQNVTEATTQATVSAPADVLFEIHHPAMLGTQVKLDEGSIVTSPVPTDASRIGSGAPDASHSYEAGSMSAVVGARFDEPRCVVSYAHHCGSNAVPEGEESARYVVEVLDGRTGMLSHGDNVMRGDANNSSISSVSSYGIREQYVATLLMATSRTAGGDGPAVAPESYVDLKRRAAGDYTAAKDVLFSDPLMFANWVQKR